MTEPLTIGTQWLHDALGQEPFPWQRELLRRFLQGCAVSSLDIPTGLGKTSVMAVWLVARALGAPVPRRLVYVVDRRAVVDQATEEAEKLREWVARNSEIQQKFGLTRALPISTLRGQHVDNREWLEDPSSPAIVIGTVDMVGSRLLYSGYGVSSKMRPYHAGLLGVDTLVALDEAHLVPAFEDLLRQIERGAEAFGPKDQSLRQLIPPFKLLSLSATGRQTDTDALTLSDEDQSHPIVLKRLNAKKTLSIVDLTTEAKTAAEVLAEQAWEMTAQGSAQVRCLVYCDKREDAEAVAKKLREFAPPEPTIELFVGARRVKERTKARNALARLGFLAGTAVNLERSAFLIATSAGEVGVDLDADHMICDLVPWERMVQRLGRVNRRGDGDAKVVVVIGSEPAPSDRKTKAAIEKREASNAARGQLDELVKKLNALQDSKVSVPKGKKQSADAKAVEEKRKQNEKELKKLISACQKRIKAFKDKDAKIVADYEATLAQYRALRKLLNTIGEVGSLSSEALRNLRNSKDPEILKALRDATTVEPLRPELTRPLVEAWSMTSLDKHPGRPEVAPWLRGFRPNDPPQTTVVWRRHLPVRADGSFDAKAAKRFFEAAPPHTSEQLETETHRVLNWLIARASTKKPEPSKTVKGLLDKRSSGADLSGKQQKEVAEYERELALYQSRPREEDVVAVLLTSRGEVKGWRRLRELQIPTGDDGKKAREKLKELLAGAMLVVDARLGGLKDGLLNEKENAIAETADDGATEWLTRPDASRVPVTGFRIRTLDASEDESVWNATPADGWVQRHLFVTSEVDGEPSAALAIDGWADDAATEDDRAEANRPQRLDEHQSWAKCAAQKIAQRLGLDSRSAHLLALAALLHDEGKRAARWQRAFGAPPDWKDGPYAKTKGPIDFDLLDGYRHELGSLRYVEDHDDFKQLAPDEQELVLHLIAAHHGFARPLISTSGCDDAPPSVIEERARAVALRFAKLTRRWGPWGLAWWEALLRAADQIASRRNQQEAQEDKP